MSRGWRRCSRNLAGLGAINLLLYLLQRRKQLLRGNLEHTFQLFHRFLLFPWFLLREGVLLFAPSSRVIRLTGLMSESE